MSLESTKARMLDIAKRRGLTHLGSCCSCLPILYGIYERADPDDVVILSCGHAGLALYCCLEEFRGQDAETLYERMGTHPERDEAAGVFCSTGSLGCGLAVAVGYAMAGRRTHVVISDGEAAEGIVWECLAYIGLHHELPITVDINANGWSAYRSVGYWDLLFRVRAFLPTAEVWNTKNEPFPDTLDAHYKRTEQLCGEPLPMNS